ncbi:DNA (cytosine-5)-methyltransferase 1 [Paraburkholderia sp. BL6665CI2N2]|uniref:DNA (cytosine-5-)-methyltransferase n=1 Tax=Paraburkholderia sp. BL6665CI2N2 TaxID=1938806 RepID=UPI0010648883|nr:DNA (cytosine-5-)-methyltransferase [Paraburkholderia sp. BL6665CI2N2]TDY22095.1 DNA (cytosine-5)-methyltransferase 1 [Paraburkholderia sp. BL6665CI2N2]
MSAQNNINPKDELRVAELFAGVGGFRIGLEDVHGNPFRVVFSNQFEPSRKKQHASEIYQARWPDAPHINEDIFKVLESEDGIQAIREASPDIVVGGFPCQDFSVAKPLSKSQGLAGRKGVLWWAIARLLQQRIEDAEPVKYLILENVDRLLSSPASCRGRDFAVILSTLHSFGYAVEWRVINAAEYGNAQRRRRVFIVAYHRSTGIYQRMQNEGLAANDSGWLARTVLNNALPCTPRNPLDGVAPVLKLRSDPFDEQMHYQPLSNGKSRFATCGFMLDGDVRTFIVDAASINDFSEFTGYVHPLTLADIVSKTGPVPRAFYIKPEDEDKWRAAKAAKSVPRTTNGFTYNYSEGAMLFPDPLGRPSRTIITSEGGTTATRTKHAIREPRGLLRRLVPDELEALNGFPRGFTARPGVSDVTRAMLMGNALVVPLVRRIGEALHRAHLNDQHNLHNA